MTHWLKPMLSPKSIAIVGASERTGSLAAGTYHQLIESGYQGRIFSVNPKYQTLYQQICYPTLSDLPEVPDLVVYGISGLALESSFDEAVSLKVGGIVIFASNYMENDDEPKLTERLKSKANAAGIPVCGGNSMGFYNYDDNVLVSFDRPPEGRPPGHIGLILHSGSGMTYLANNDARFCFNYVIASAQETNGTVGDYVDYLLEQSSTKVIAIMLEAVRNIPAFIQALKKAQDRDIPVLITKLARTEKSAKLALSHSGAIVGDHEAFVAVCKRYGVVLTRDLDEMIITAMLFAADTHISNGGIAGILDSGGMREQMIDLADDYSLRFAEISEHSKAIMREHLDTGLEADNPLDGMGSLSHSIEETYLECGKALLDDPDTSLLTFEFEFRDDFSHYPVLFDVINQLSIYSEKPVVVVNSCTFTNLQQTAARLTQQGTPVVNGIDVCLRALRHLTRYSTENNVDISPSLHFEESRIDRWKTKLDRASNLDELESLALMADFGLPVVEYRLCNDEEAVLIAAENTGYPVVMKTAEPGIQHKSDLGGVIVGIGNQQELIDSYRALSDKIGKRVVLMPMVDKGVEVSLGMKYDVDYGPLVIIATGGIFIELIKDRCFALAPLSEAQVDSMLDELKLSKLLAGLRGQPAVNRQALVELIVHFSELVYAFGDSISEIDLNPVIVTEQGCTIVDALVVS